MQSDNALTCLPIINRIVLFAAQSFVHCTTLATTTNSFNDAIVFHGSFVWRHLIQNVEHPTLSEKYKTVTARERQQCNLAPILCFVVRHRCLQTLHALVASGVCNVNAKTDQHKLAALHCIAASRDEEKIANMLLAVTEPQRADVDIENADGMTPLCLAVMHDRMSMVSLLISHGGADPAAGRDNLRPILVAASSTNSSAFMMHKLIVGAAGDDAISRRRKQNQTTALVDVARNNSGHTALALACIHAKLDVVEELLSNGAADPACACSASQEVRGFGGGESTSGSNSNSNSTGGCEKIFLLCESLLAMPAVLRDTKMVKALLDSPAIATRRRRQQQRATPDRQLQSFLNGMVEADVIQSPRRIVVGWKDSHTTPLILATLSSWDESVELLLEAGADPSLRHPVRGRTALEVAQAEKNSKIVKLMMASLLRKHST